jgi:hypothetical protein
MFSRDFIIRQVQQLTQALAVVLFHKKAARPDQAQVALDEALAAATDLDPEALRRLDRPDLLAVCSAGGTLLPDHAVALADLLYEDATAAGRERALWLYDAALDAGAAVPLDIHDRLAVLRASLAE